MSLALSLCQYVLRPKRGLAQVSPGLAWLRPGLAEPRSASIAGLHQHNRKGKIVMIKTRRYKRLVFGFVFCTWNWYDFWRRSWGLPCISWTPRFQRTSKKCRLLVYYLTDILGIRSASQGILFLLNAVYHFRDSLIRTSLGCLYDHAVRHPGSSHDHGGSCHECFLVRIFQSACGIVVVLMIP